MKIRKSLIELLKKYKHVFAWTPTDMVGVDRGVIEHKLMIRLDYGRTDHQDQQTFTQYDLISNLSVSKCQIS